MTDTKCSATGTSSGIVSRTARRMAFHLGLALMLCSSASFGVLFTGAMSGAAESPPTGSTGTGLVIVNYDATTHMLSVQANFSGLGSGTTAAHIHCCTVDPNTLNAGVATQVPSFAGFPLGVTSGGFSNTYDLTLDASWNPSFVTANGGTPGTAEAALAAGMLANKSYFNIHTTNIPGGEIRAFLTPSQAVAPAILVPTLSPWLMGLLAAILFFAAFRFLRRRNG